jgi:hypothetical protein
MSNEPKLRRATRPKGIVVLVLLLYLAAGLVVLSSIIGGDTIIPSDITALITICFLVLAWGLWKLFRWAWSATIIMFILNSFYILSNGLRTATPLISLGVGLPIVVALTIIAYLLSEKVRRVYWANGWEEVA